MKIVSGIFTLVLLIFSQGYSQGKEKPIPVTEQEGTTHAFEDSSSTIVQTSIDIDGMTCSLCAMSIKKTLLSMEGVKEAEVSLEDKSAEVSFEPERVTVQQLVERINKIGYKAYIPEGTLKLGSRKD